MDPRFKPGSNPFSFLPSICNALSSAFGIGNYHRETTFDSDFGTSSSSSESSSVASYSPHTPSSPLSLLHGQDLDACNGMENINMAFGNNMGHYGAPFYDTTSGYTPQPLPVDLCSLDADNNHDRFGAAAVFRERSLEQGTALAMHPTQVSHQNFQPLNTSTERYISTPLSYTPQMESFNFNTLRPSDVPLEPPLGFFRPDYSNNALDFYVAQNDATSDIVVRSETYSHHQPTQAIMTAQQVEGSSSHASFSNPAPLPNIKRTPTPDVNNGRRTRSMTLGKRKLTPVEDSSEEDDRDDDPDFHPTISKHLTSKFATTRTANTAFSRQATPSSSSSIGTDASSYPKRRKSLQSPESNETSIVTPQTRFGCTWDNCGETFGRLADRDRHIRSIHMGRDESVGGREDEKDGKSLRSDCCGYIFSRIDAKTRHEKKACDGIPRKERPSQYKVNKKKGKETKRATKSKRGRSKG